MIIQSIRVRDFLSHADSTICFEDGSLWLISGENGAGGLRPRHIAEGAGAGDQCGVARHHAGTKPRQPGAFGQRMKSEKAVEVACLSQSRGQGADRRLVEINIGIAFVGQHDEIMALRQCE